MSSHSYSHTYPTGLPGYGANENIINYDDKQHRGHSFQMENQNYERHPRVHDNRRRDNDKMGRRHDNYQPHRDRNQFKPTIHSHYDERSKGGNQKEYQSDDEEVNGKLFVGGLTFDTSEETFRFYFEKFGELKEATLMKHRMTNVPRGFGFVKFQDPSAVDKVLSQTHTLNGRVLEIKKAVPRERVSVSLSKPSKGYEPKKIFIGGLSLSTTEDELKEYFSKFGSVAESVIVVDHETHRPRGFGFITFDDQYAVDQALAERDIEIHGKVLEVKRAELKENSQSKSGPPHNSFQGKGKSGKPESHDYQPSSYFSGHHRKQQFQSSEGYNNSSRHDSRTNYSSDNSYNRNHPRRGREGGNYKNDHQSHRKNDYSQSYPKYNSSSKNHKEVVRPGMYQSERVYAPPHQMTNEYPYPSSSSAPVSAPNQSSYPISDYYNSNAYGGQSQGSSYNETGYGAYRGQHTMQGRNDRSFRPY